MAQNYKKAFKCSKCPGSNDEDGCPMWWELTETIRTTGEVRVTKGCGHTLTPRLLVSCIGAVDGQAAADNGTRNAIVEGFKKVSDILDNMTHSNTTDSKRLEDHGN